jgi:hypothetical protein
MLTRTSVPKVPKKASHCLWRIFLFCWIKPNTTRASDVLPGIFLLHHDTMSSISGTAESTSTSSYFDRQTALPFLGTSTDVALNVLRQKTSPIWLHCRLADGKTDPGAWVDSDGTRWWHCQPCFEKKKAKRYKYSGGSSTIISHLRKEHNIMICGKHEASREVTKRRLGSIASFLAGEASHPAKKRKSTAEEDELDPETLRELFCRYTVACSLPFAHVEQPSFRDLILYSASCGRSSAEVWRHSQK